MYLDINTLKEPDFTGIKILVAEDDKINFMLIELILKGTGALVYHAWNGLQVLEFIRKYSDISIILMDIKMPVMNGYDATIQAKKINPQLKIIAQTAYALGEDKYKCYEAGCIDYIAKPICKDNLFEVLERHI